MPYYYHSYRRKKPKKKIKKVVLFVIAFFALYLGFIFLSNKNPKTLTAQTYNLDLTQTASHPKPELAWPGYGQSAIGANGYGVLDSHNTSAPAPMASLAKVMTALAVLDKYPLQPGEEGPKIKITEKDEEFFGNHLAVGGASVHLIKGSEISEYHALQLMLIKSYNNVADTLANWAFGSIDEYTKYANQKAQEIGMKNTNFSDASGLLPQTIATASDLVLLGDYALDNPVIAQIVATWQTDIPGFGEKTNTNQFLDFEGNGVIGIKTGDTEEAGGTYLVAAKRTIENTEIILIAAVLGAPNHFAGQRDTMPLIDSMQTGFKKLNLVDKSKTLGNIAVSKTESVEFGVDEQIDVLAWSGQKINPQIKLDQIIGKNSNEIGKLIVNMGTADYTYQLVRFSR
ncbi:D-alanyl-D-alanine carboxypeptidase [Candidatus Saccharibacteria bacterium CPR2]|nr:D-alanyl-D-alanine carboxypeptidase [Candidatus Saccharibacteria bacterium CPR2]